MKEFTICIYVKGFKQVLNKLFFMFGNSMLDECTFTVKAENVPGLEAACANMGLEHGKLKDWCYTDEL